MLACVLIVVRMCCCWCVCLLLYFTKRFVNYCTLCLNNTPVSQEMWAGAAADTTAAHLSERIEGPQYRLENQPQREHYQHDKVPRQQNPNCGPYTALIIEAVLQHGLTGVNKELFPCDAEMAQHRAEMCMMIVKSGVYVQ